MRGDLSGCAGRKVVSRKELGENTLKLHAGERVDMNFVTDVLRSYGFEYVDYVYEPGQYAVRGSIIDVFSFSSEYPFRIDFLAMRWKASVPSRWKHSSRRRRKKAS